MPILLPEPPPPAFPPAQAPQLPVFSLSGNGDTIDLTIKNGIIVLDGLQGFDMPPVVETASAPTGWDGGLLEQVRHDVREVFMPLALIAATTPEFRELKNRLACLLSPKVGLTTVTFRQGDGTTRSIEGLYAAGMDTTIGEMEGLAQQRLGVMVRCYDPAWLGPNIVGVEYRIAGTAVFLSSPFLPMTVIGSQAFGTNTIVNEGDEESWPVFTITGPGDDFIAQNGEYQWEFTGHINAGEVITVDTRRGVQTVQDQAGVSQWSRIGHAAQMWSLRPGTNTVTASLTGATTDTSIRIEYRPRFLTAW